MSIERIKEITERTEGNYYTFNQGLNAKPDILYLLEMVKELEEYKTDYETLSYLLNKRFPKTGEDYKVEDVLKENQTLLTALSAERERVKELEDSAGLLADVILKNEKLAQQQIAALETRLKGVREVLSRIKYPSSLSHQDIHGQHMCISREDYETLTQACEKGDDKKVSPKPRYDIK